MINLNKTFGLSMNFPTYMLVNMTSICETMDMLFAFRLGDCLTELYV